MSFIFISSDAADRQFQTSAESTRRRQDSTLVRDSELPAVRRPYRGFQVKDDTYATISIFDSRGVSIPLISESSRTPATDDVNTGKVRDFADFILQGVQIQRVEKQQIVETFGDSFIFFFGERPQIWVFSGMLVNTEDFNWHSQFLANYETYLSGTKLVQRNARAFLAYDTRVVEGYPLQFASVENSSEPNVVRFTMPMFVTNYKDFSDPGDVTFPAALENDIAVLNAELDLKSREFNENTIPARVRLQNLIAGGVTSSLGSTLRELTKITNTVTNFVDAIRVGAFSLLSGRVVTTPIGVSGFTESIGVAQFAAGTVNQAALDIARARGPTTLRIAAPSRFVEHALPRGRKSDSVDEYPLAQGGLLVKPESLLEASARTRAAIAATREARDASLVAQNLQAQGQRDVLRGIADVIRFSQRGFTMIKTAKNVVDTISNSSNPAATARNFVADALGAGGVLPGQKRFADPSAVDQPVLPPGQERFRDPASAGAVQSDDGATFLRSLGQ